MIGVRALFGRGRSGTTWVGHILNQYPLAIYKYEPFNEEKQNAYCKWLSSLSRAEDVQSDQLRTALESIFKECLHDVDYPPFPYKSAKSHPLLLRAAWQLGKYVPPMRWIYNSIGKARWSDQDCILIKQVNFPNELLAAFHQSPVLDR